MASRRRPARGTGRRRGRAAATDREPGDRGEPSDSAEHGYREGPDVVGSSTFRAFRAVAPGGNAVGEPCGLERHAVADGMPGGGSVIAVK